MADIEFECPDCGKSIVVDEKIIGKTAKCPHCNAPLAFRDEGTEEEISSIETRRTHSAATSVGKGGNPDAQMVQRVTPTPPVPKPEGDQPHRSSAKQNVVGAILGLAMTAAYIWYDSGSSSVSVGDIHRKCPSCGITASITTCQNCGAKHRFVRETKRGWVSCGNCKKTYVGFECQDCGAAFYTDDLDHVWLK